MQPLYVLVVARDWARLYRADLPPTQLTLVYHHARFGRNVPRSEADEELARSLCRLLRADRQTGKYRKLVMLASSGMLAALRKQYDGDWDDVVLGSIEHMSTHNNDDELCAHVRHLLVMHKPNGSEKAACEIAPADAWKKAPD